MTGMRKMSGDAIVTPDDGTSPRANEIAELLGGLPGGVDANTMQGIVLVCARLFVHAVPPVGIEAFMAMCHAVYHHAEGEEAVYGIVSPDEPIPRN